jgi:glycosyltransferase involved in cell wall biosynthesis
LGEIEPARRFDCINQADICALPLIDTSIGARYTSPLKLFEYMAMGKAIVASDLPSIRTVLAHETSALLAAPGDAEALGAALRRLTEDLALRQSLAAAALRLAAGYSWAARAHTIRDFIVRTVTHGAA